MSDWLLGNGKIGSGVIGMGLFGQGDEDNPYSGIQLPKEVTDPLYTSSQADLNKLGTGLINGDIPDYYKSIGDFNSPQFQAMLNSVKGQVMQGSQEASAINGTGRSGVGVTASNNALNSILPQLSYQDYNRAISGRGALLDTGINVQSGVRQSAQNQQQFDSNWNQMLYQDQLQQTGLIDGINVRNAQAQGQMMGNVLGIGASIGLAPFTGGASLAGLPGFASGLSGGGGNEGLSSLFNSISKINTPSNTQSGSPLLDQSGLGSFSNQNPVDLTRALKG